ncbi:MAG: hypothetical protein K2I00_09955 [Ruminococcus sp.]|nr:hypothetical protein [Ruminococcus sp.]
MADKSNSVLTIRADKEIKAKFKLLAENLGNQGTALESLLNAYEMQTAKNVLTDRRSDIENFDTHLQAISSAFLHSLEITENTTERVKAEFQSRLESKDLTISDLQERIRQSEQAEQTAREQATAIECEMSALNEQTSIQLESLNTELDSVRKALDTATEQVTDKQSLLDEYRTRLEKAEKDVAELPELKERVSAAEQETKRLTAELAKQKDEFETKITVLQERAEFEKEKAVLKANQEHTKEEQKQTKEIQRLYAEIDRLRQENLTLSTNLATLNAEKSKKETE